MNKKHYHKYRKYKLRDIMGYESQRKENNSSLVNYLETRSKPEEENTSCKSGYVDNHADIFLIEIPDNSDLVRLLQQKHPRIFWFEKRYENFNWRANL